MTGLTDYTAQRLLNYVSGQTVEPALPSVWLGLFTVPGTDANTGFTECAGNGYARVQVAGPVTAGSAISTASSTFTGPNVSGFPWVVPGMSIYSATAGAIIGTLLSWVGTTVTLTANATNNSSGAADVLNFSAFSRAIASGPSTITNNSAITFPIATGGGAGFGTANSWGLFDALTVGNLLLWDYLGNFQWLPTTVSAASPGVLTAKAHGYANGDNFVFSIEYGGTAPTFSAGNYNGVLTAAGVTTDTLNVTGVNTSATGSGSVRKVVPQAIPSGVTASFAAASLNALAA